MIAPINDAGLGQRIARSATACVLLATMLLAGCRPPESTADNELPEEPIAYEAIEAHEPAYDFALPTLDGGSVRLSELRGHWVLVNFWATWCAPCRDEMPYLDRLGSQHPGNLVVLAVNMREPPSVIAPFVAELGIDLPILLQPDDAMLLAYDVRGLPVSVLIDPAGMVVLRTVGPLAEDVIETAIP